MKTRLFATDVIDNKLSDHRPLIHNGVLFWNIMMQGRMRRDHSFNNGFGLVESEKSYLRRLNKVSSFIIEMITNHPEIDVITLCEGPILPHHQEYFISMLMAAPVMQRFVKDASTSAHHEEYPNWGLWMMPDKKFKISPVTVEEMYKLAEFPQLVNRLRLWELADGNDIKYIALAHLPFNQSLSTNTGDHYKQLITSILNKYQHKDLTFCADFNFNPYLIDEYPHREADLIPANNSMLITEQQANCPRKTEHVTVDGILLSALNKQRRFDLKFNPGLFGRLKREWGFARQYIENDVENTQDKQLQICTGFNVL